MKTDSHSMKYISNEGTEIKLTVPWPSHTGMIPPPEIVFYYDKDTVTFIYRGSA